MHRRIAGQSCSYPEFLLLPGVIAKRVTQLAADLRGGMPLAESLTKRGLATESMRGLIVTAEKTHTLPWALQELGDSLSRRAARVGYRIVMVLFPLTIFACAFLVALVAIAMFYPLLTLLEKVAHG